jgi:hypothetical protein
MTQRLNLILECEGQESIKEALYDLGYGIKNDIYFALDFPITDSAFSHYNAAVAAIHNKVAATAYEGVVYLQFLNVEAFWNTGT